MKKSEIITKENDSQEEIYRMIVEEIKMNKELRGIIGEDSYNTILRGFINMYEKDIWYDSPARKEFTFSMANNKWKVKVMLSWEDKIYAHLDAEFYLKGCGRNGANRYNQYCAAFHESGRHKSKWELGNTIFTWMMMVYADYWKVNNNVTGEVRRCA